jgi:hypothetical protein
MTVRKDAHFLIQFPCNLLNIFTDANICVEFVLAMFYVCCGLVLSIMNISLQTY